MRSGKNLKSTVKKRDLFVILTGSVVGFINGLLGGGGGSLVVPIYEGALGLPAKKAHASAVVTILPLCVLSSIIYLARGGVDYRSLGLVSVGVVVGGFVGSYILRRLSNDLLTVAFYCIMLYAGVRSVTG